MTTFTECMKAASKLPLAKVRYPCYLSAKLDGVRNTCIEGKGARSRQLEPIPNPHASAMLAHPMFYGMDGELCAVSPTAKNCFRATMSALSRLYGKPKFKFYVFDDYLLALKGVPFEKRMWKLKIRIDAMKQAGIDYVEFLPQKLVHDEAELTAYEERVLKLGFEGLIGRAPQGFYKMGRSTPVDQYMFKVKRFIDGEAKVIGVLEEMHNGNAATRSKTGRTKRLGGKAGKTGKDRAGKLQCKLLRRHGLVAKGTVFKMGSGLDDKEREWFWKHRHAIEAGEIDLIAKFKSLDYGVKDKPREPVFLGLRGKWDM